MPDVSSFGGEEDKMICKNKKNTKRTKNKEAQNLKQILSCAPGKMKGGREINKHTFVHLKIPKGYIVTYLLTKDAQVLERNSFSPDL